MNRSAASPIGHLSTHSVHASPCERTQTGSYTWARPMRIMRGSASGSKAPLAHFCVHSNPSQTTHGARSGSMAGVPAAWPYDESSKKIAFAGQTSAQAPHRKHVSRNVSSSLAPGGRSHGRSARVSSRCSMYSATGPMARPRALRKNARRFDLSRLTLAIRLTTDEHSGSEHHVRAATLNSPAHLTHYRPEC